MTLQELNTQRLLNRLETDIERNIFDKFDKLFVMKSTTKQK